MECDGRTFKLSRTRIPTVKPTGPHREGEEPKPMMHGGEKSDFVIVCAGQRPDREGSSPSGARVRSAVSKGGGNASLAEARGRYGAA